MIADSGLPIISAGTLAEAARDAVAAARSSGVGHGARKDWKRQ